MKIPRKVIVHQLGRLGYRESLKKQQTAEKDLKSIVKNSVEPPYHGSLFLVEHNPVYTTGVRDQGYDEELEKRLIGLKAEFFRSNRGGLITFHGPGQLVAYPIVYLKYFDLSVRTYVTSLESTIIKLCEFYGIKAYTCEHTGVWVNDKKICAIGVRCSMYVTTHGIALNCNTDLSWFSNIVPCGIEGKGVTSLSKELHRDVTIGEVAPIFLKYFGEVFNAECISAKDEK